MNDTLYKDIVGFTNDLLNDGYTDIITIKEILMSEYNYKDMDIRESIWRGLSDGYFEFVGASLDIRKGYRDAGTE